jgi:hypothetical protein
MIKSILNSIWEVLVAIGEAKQARYKRRGFSGYY